MADVVHFSRDGLRPLCGFPTPSHLQSRRPVADAVTRVTEEVTCVACKKEMTIRDDVEGRRR